MLKRIQVRNFRGLRDLSMEPLSRVNLIAGKNNSGKTSLLEAMFLLFGAGNPQLALNANVIRNISLVGRIDPDSGVLSVVMAKEHPWKELFFGLDMDRSIQVLGGHAFLGEMILHIAAGISQKSYAAVEQSNSASVTNQIGDPALTFSYSDSGKDQAESYVRVTANGLDFNRADAEVPYAAIILLPRSAATEEDVVRLGRIKQQKRGDIILDALQIIEPRLQGIEELSGNGAPAIWGDIGLSELVPLSVMGDGMVRLARLVLAVSSVPGGLVLVDEIENGFHHALLPDVWRVIDRIALQSNAQVFATTQSYECVKAAQEALSSERFLYHRLDAADSMVHCVTYTPDSIEAAIRHDLEVR